MMLRTVLAGAVALLVAGCDNTSDLEKQCAEECRKAGRGYRLVPLDAPKTAQGEQPMQCRCVAN
jgi:hypothetical protein